MLRRLYRQNQPKVRSTTQRRGNTSKPLASSLRLTISRTQLQVFLTRADEFSGVTTVSPYQFQSWQCLPDLFQDQPGSVPILHVACVDNHSQHQANRVCQDVALPALEVLGCIVAAYPPFSVVFTDWLSRIPALGCSSRPALARTSLRRASFMPPKTPSRGRATEVVVYRLPRREVVRQHPPSTA